MIKQTTIKNNNNNNNNARRNKTDHGEMQGLRSDLAEKNSVLRRGRVVSMLAQSMTGVEMAKQLKVHESTISRDIQYLKEQSQQFIYDLAKTDLAFEYMQCLSTITEIKKRLWRSYSKKEDMKLLKQILECEQAKFSMLKDGHMVMSVKALEEKLSRFERARQAE